MALLFAGPSRLPAVQARGADLEQTGSSAFDQALAAELAFNPGAVAVSSGDMCPAQGNAAGATCVIPVSSADAAARGIAEFGVGSPLGSGATEVLGQEPSGAWQFWFGTQNVVYQLLDLPGAIIVCAGGDGLNVRSGPSTDGAAVAKLADGTQMAAEQFVLTDPGDHTTLSAGRGGWYRISSPVQGWVYSRFISTASLGDCTWHDQLVSAGAN